MSLPFIPGYSFDKNLGRNRFHKSQAFEYRNDVPVYFGESKPGIGGVPLPGQDLSPKTSVFPTGAGPASPAWVAFDRQVLRFTAYFQEAVHELRGEQYRVRKCLIYFYLEDDSIQVIEPKVSNSGIPQGTLIRRHRVPHPPPNDDRFYNIEDFNVGKEITLYSRTFKITDCDQFTRRFLNKLGTHVPSADSIPLDPYSDQRQRDQDSMQPLRPYEKHDTFKQFLDHDRHVLRFNCVWDDTDNMFGDTRELVLHYFLADDTIEILETIPPNSGRDTVPMFLKRARLPKGPTPLPKPGEVADRTVLNVFGPTGYGGRYILDSLKDFYIGAVIEFNHFKFVLVNCDDYALRYMEKHCPEFPLADWQLICQRLKAAAKEKKEDFEREFGKHDAQKVGKIGFDLFKRLLMQLTGGTLCEHEVITLGRHYGDQQEAPSEMQDLVEFVRDCLRQENFHKLPELQSAMHHLDVDHTGYLNKSDIRQLCVTFPVPLNEEILEELIQRSQQNETGQLNYQAFIDSLDWRKLTTFTKEDIHTKTFDCASQALGRVIYSQLFQDIFS